MKIFNTIGFCNPNKHYMVDISENIEKIKVDEDLIKGELKMKKDNYFQYLRALAILAVILIHVLPQTSYSIIIRQFVNFSVGMFLFLSGYLTSEKSVENIKEFYKKRIIRVLIPYLIWSLVWVVYNKDFNMKVILFKLVTGQCCGIYYYILVYIQLVLLTPILFKLLDKKLMYIVTPLFLCVLYLFSIFGKSIPFPYNVNTFFPWLIFYFYGLRFRNKELKVNLNKNIILYILFIILSIVEGFFWNKQDNYNLAISQTKITSMFATLCFINIAMALKDKIKCNCKVLKAIGDCSFGMYLTHFLFLRIVRYRVSNTLLRYAVVVTVTILFILIVKKIVGDKLSRYLGFN